MQNPITVHLIWVTDESDTLWLADAWDEYSVDGNPEGWEGAIRKAEQENTAVRITTTQLPYDQIEALFKPAPIPNSGISAPQPDPCRCGANDPNTDGPCVCEPIPDAE